jgi:opacity protein-like surface antigen
MKTLLLLPLILALPANAGTSAKEVIAPPPEPCLTSWFLGGSVGYLTEFEEPMYNIHAGVTNSCWNLAGWNLSLFGEVGYTSHDENLLIVGATALYANYDLTIVPITLNFKLERPLVGNLNAYFGAGLGAAWVGLDVDSVLGSASEDDWVFTAQVFTGLSYDVTKNFEVYGGARWIYYSDADFAGVDWDMEDDWLFELGLRFNF